MPLHEHGNRILQSRVCVRECTTAESSGNRYHLVRQTINCFLKVTLTLYSGSDAAGPAIGTAWGLSLHQELALFVEKCGFTPEEAIKSATSVTAKKFQFQDRGRISEGLRADLVLVEGNPLKKIDHTLDLRAVWRNGVLCSTYASKV